MARTSRKAVASQALPYPARWLCEQIARTRWDSTVRCGLSHHVPGRFVPARKFTDYDIHYIIGGELEYGFPDRTLRVRNGRFIILPPGTSFSERGSHPDKDVTLYFAHFQPDPGGPDPLKALDLPVTIKSPARAESVRLFEALIEATRARRGGDPWAMVHTQGHLIGLLARVLEAGFQQGQLKLDPAQAAPDWLWPVLRSIDQGIGQSDLNVDALAGQAHLSPSHFAHQFRRYTGTSPKKLLLRKRMERACSLLIGDASLSVKQIAGRCGFADPYHFSAQFKKWSSLSPTDYRASRDMGARA